MQRRTLLVRALWGVVYALVAPVLFGGQPPATPPTPPNPLPAGMGQYIMVLWESGTPFPDNPQQSMKVTEPDVPALGGQVIYKSGNRRVIRLPLAAAAALRRNEAVAFLQRMWMGESLDHWSESLPANEEASSTSGSTSRRHTTEVDTNLQWGPKAYSYDGSGDITQIGTDQYIYDTAGRLIRATVSGKTEGYAYDAFGNLIVKSVVGGNPVYIPVDGSSNRISGVSYDAAGNALSGGGGDTPRTYVYDSLNRVSHIRPYGSDRRYIYDASDEQVGMTFAGDEISHWTFRDFDGQVIREFKAENFDQSGGGYWIWEEDSFYGEGMLLGGEMQPFSLNYNGTTTTWGGKRHYHLDHLGSVRMVTDDMGRSLSEDDYFPFGATITRTYQEQFNWNNPQIDTNRFAGHRRDFLGSLNVDNTDYLDYMHARYYDPNLGRFLSVDPLLGSIHAPQSWNRYSYVRNSPIGSLDPRGLFSIGADCNSNPMREDCRLRDDAQKKQPEVHEEITVTAKDPGFLRGLLYRAALTFTLNRMHRPWTADELTAMGVPVSHMHYDTGVIIGPLPLGVGAAAAETTVLYRAVMPAELADIENLGVFRNLGSAEGKYFTVSSEEASFYAKQAVQRFGDPAYTTVRTVAPASVFEGLTPATVDRGIQAWVIPDNRLTVLQPEVLNSMAVPPE